MSDLRAYQLARQLVESIASIDNVVLWTDKAGNEEANRINITDLISSALVSAGTNNYQGMTPQAFWNSVATTARRGVTQHATSAEIDSGQSGNIVVKASELKRKLDELKSVQSLLATGYINFAEGLQLRWGNVLSVGDGPQSFLFVSPFAHACFIVVTDITAGNTTVKSANGFTYDRLNELSSITFSYLAVGW